MARWTTYPQRGIIDQIIADKAATWDEGVQKLGQDDAQHVLEALVAEYGVEAAVRALDNQGYSGNAARWVLQILYEEAVRRRKIAHEAPPELSDEEFEALADQLAEEAAAIHKRQGEPKLNIPITREEIYQDHP